MSFDNGIVEVWPEDEYREDLGFDVRDDYDEKPKKNKNKNNNDSKKTLVDIKHEGFTLEKAQPRVGEKSSWARIGQRPLPFDDKTLVDMVKKHRKRKGQTVDEDFKELTLNQQGVVQRLLDERRRKEKTKNAEWILYDVQRFGQWRWRTIDVKQIQVIFKRVDKTMPLKNGEYVRSASKNQYHDFEIIDLAEPNSGNSNKKNKDKKVKKAKSYDDVMFDAENDPLGLSGFGQQRDHGRNNHNHNDQHFHQPQPQFGHLPPMPPPTHAPPGAFPPDLNLNMGGPGSFGLGQPPFPPQQFHQPHQPHSARQSFTNVNPFQPNPDVASMNQFELPPQHNDPIFPHPHQSNVGLDRANSQGRERRLSARRQSMGGDPEHIRRLESKLDNLTLQISSGKHHGSDSSEYDNETAWSHDYETDWTPPSSPRSYFSEHKTRGSLERRRSSTTRDPRYHPRYRSHRYQDAEIEPAYTYRSDRRTYSPEYRRGSKRPSLIHAATYDDYPAGSSSQPRALPMAPTAPRPQRRLTGFEDRDRYENQGYDDRRSDMRDRHDARGFDDRYDSRRRESAYSGGGGRRSSYVGGGGGGSGGGGGGYYS